MKTYILTIDQNTNPIVKEFTDRAIESCNKFNQDYELVYGPNRLLENITGFVACARGHERVWKQIISDGEAAVVMEHDGYWEKPLDFEPESERHFYNLTNTRLGHGQIVTPYTAELFCGLYDRWGYVIGADTVYNNGAPFPFNKDQHTKDPDVKARRAEVLHKYVYCQAGRYIGGNNGYSSIDGSSH